MTEIQCGNSPQPANSPVFTKAPAAGADTIVTACAFGMHMLQDSLKLLNYDETMRVIDVASLTTDSLEPPKKATAWSL